MQFRKWSLYILLLVVTASFFLLPVTKPYPDYPLSESPALFEGSRAYRLLEELVSKYPGRFVGTEAARQSAAWVEGIFDELGLETSRQPFPAYYNRAIMDEKMPGPFLKDMTAEVEGVNVIGISPGQSEEIIIIGAHRDVIFTQEGAEDNGSGTVTMLELARVLTQGGLHYYTYMFVSFDGEETGLYGSYALAESLTGQKIKLALSIDMVGIAGSDGVDLYEFISRDGQSPLWTLVLAKNLGASSAQRAGINSRWQYLARRMFGLVPTDTHPFLIRGIPVLGTLASDPGGKRIIHDPGDVIDKISAQTLDQSGKFLERYILSVAGAPNQSSQTYIPFASGYIPGWVYPLHLGLALIALAGIPLQNLYRYVYGGGKPGTVIKQELKWLLPGLIGALVLGVMSWSLTTDYVQEQVIVILIPIGFLLVIGLALVTLIVTAIFRSKKSGAPERRAALNIYLLLLFLMAIPLIGPLATLVLTLLPITALSLAPRRLIWRICAIGLWALSTITSFGIFMVHSLSTFGNPFTPVFALSLAWFVLLTYTSGLYTMAAPTPSPDSAELELLPAD